MVIARCRNALGLNPYRRVFQIYFPGEVGEGLESLYLYYDGEELGDVTPPHEPGGYMSLPDYRSFAAGLEPGYDSDLEREVHLMFCMMGRITGS
ncbi:hypothetical protein [Sphaerimonospora thailandensis]|uniref:Uncharacterized protein n=1 Tax=Sphaerimonospora thailandensis TaxID=795644 RepID=A0A8J3W241_9ACTN|nr:hypothetical protein [Sphaerimonospora thailandensis]GIH72391.1 hypothetical protein Mth01_46440 [Sphaerimonospora thailandensis]